jgi:hypothetical protein
MWCPAMPSDPAQARATLATVREREAGCCCCPVRVREVVALTAAEMKSS